MKMYAVFMTSGVENRIILFIGVVSEQVGCEGRESPACVGDLGLCCGCTVHGRAASHGSSSGGAVEGGGSQDEVCMGVCVMSWLPPLGNTGQVYVCVVIAIAVTKSGFSVYIYLWSRVCLQRYVIIPEYNIIYFTMRSAGHGQHLLWSQNCCCKVTTGKN